jgi:transcriptional regulator with XRE-family HTH domain
MTFQALVENLRAILWERIESAELTGLELAHQTGFRQAHISNFLNDKRGLSIEGLDKVLAVQHLSVLDLLDPHEVSRRARILPPSDSEFANLVLVDPDIAATQPVMISHYVRDTLKVRRSLLKRFRPELQAADRRSWERFVYIKVEAREGMSMYPRLLPGALVLLDRHYTSLKPYRKQERNLYAIRKKDTCVLKYVEHSGKQFILRPENPAYPVELLPLEPGRSVTSYIVGRVAQILIET